LLQSAQSSGILGAGDPAIIASEFFGLLLGDVLLRMILHVSDPPAVREIDRRARAATEAVLRLYSKTNI
jgi:hypothetical protein